MPIIKTIIDLEKNFILANSYRGRLKQGLARCRKEAQEYHACVTVHHL